MILANRFTILSNIISKVCFPYYFNRKSQKIFLFGLYHCFLVNIELISLGIRDKKGLAYSSQNTYFNIQKDNFIIIIYFLSLYTFSKVYFVQISNKWYALWNYIKNCSRYAKSASKWKLITNLLTLHCWIAYWNARFVDQLSIIVTNVNILHSFHQILFVRKVFIEAKILR